MPRIPLAAQLYTVRDLTQSDFAATVRQVARIGYTSVELAGFGNLSSAKEAKKALDDAGLAVAGAHIDIEILEQNLSEALDEQVELGNKNILCPWLPEERRQNAAAWRQVAASLGKIGAACASRGFEFAYHNHSFEFQKFDGQTAMEIIWSSTDPATVKSELDVYWVQHAGEDPVAYMHHLGERILSLHLKDMARGDEQKFAPVGSGILDFPAILAAAAALGVRNYVVEQDATYDLPPLEALRMSFEYLKNVRTV